MGKKTKSLDTTQRSKLLGITRSGKGFLAKVPLDIKEKSRNASRRAHESQQTQNSEEKEEIGLKVLGCYVGTL